MAATLLLVEILDGDFRDLSSGVEGINCPESCGSNKWHLKVGDVADRHYAFQAFQAAGVTELRRRSHRGACFQQQPHLLESNYSKQSKHEYHKQDLRTHPFSTGRTKSIFTTKTIQPAHEINIMSSTSDSTSLSAQVSKLNIKDDAVRLSFPLFFLLNTSN
jgi:hypothetical protein